MDVQCPFRNVKSIDVFDEPKNVSFSEFIFERIAKFTEDRERIALYNVETDEKWRYCDIQAPTTQCIAKFREVNARSSSRIALITSHTAKIVMLHLAAVEIGCTIISINGWLNEDDVWNQIVASGCTHSIVENQFIHKINEGRRKNVLKANFKITKTLEEFFEENKLTKVRRSISHSSSTQSSSSKTRDNSGGKNGTAVKSIVGRHRTSSPSISDKERTNGSFDSIAASTTPTSAGEMALVFFSYGSSTAANSLPNAVTVTQRALITNLRQLSAPIFADDEQLSRRVLLPISAHNLFGMISLYYALIGGSTVYILQKFTTKCFANAIMQHKFTRAYLTLSMLQGVQQLDESLVSRIAEHLRSVFVGGSRFNEPLERRIKLKLNLDEIRNMFITTELGAICTFSNASFARLGSVGTPLADVVLRVVDVDNDERVCDPREIGRLLVAGPQFAAATANTMNGAGIASSSSSSTNVEKFIKTSDVACYDEDGCVYVVDKANELIRDQNNELVCPSTIESIICSYPSIADSAIVLVDASSVSTENVFAAFLVRTMADNFHSTVITAFDIKQHLLANLSTPLMECLNGLRGGVHFIAEIPRSMGGRILRRKLAQLYERERIASTGYLPRSQSRRTSSVIGFSTPALNSATANNDPMSAAQRRPTRGVLLSTGPLSRSVQVSGVHDHADYDRRKVVVRRPEARKPLRFSASATAEVRNRRSVPASRLSATSTSSINGSVGGVRNSK